MQKAEFIERGEKLVKHREKLEQATAYFQCESQVIQDWSAVFTDLLEAYEVLFSPFEWYIYECDCGKKPMKWNDVSVDSLDKLWEVWSVSN